MTEACMLIENVPWSCPCNASLDLYANHIALLMFVCAHSSSWGVANRGASVRVGRSVPVEKCGYYEDRRPSSNFDPYVVTRLITETVLLDK